MNPHENLAGQRLPPLVAGRRRLWLAAVVANASLQAGLAVAAAWAAKRFVEALLQAPSAVGTASSLPPLAPEAAAALVGVVVLLLAAALLRAAQLPLSEALVQHYIAHLRLRLLDRLAVLAPDGRLRRSRGGLMLRFVGDAQALRAWTGRGIAESIAALIAGAALLAALAVLQPLLAVAAASWMLLAGVLMSITLPRLRQRIAESRRRQAALAAHLYDRIATLPQWQAGGSARHERARLRRIQRRLRRALQLRAKACALHRVLLDVCLAGMSASLLGLIAVGPAVTPADGGLVVGVFGLVALLAAPLRRIGRALEAREAARVARLRMQELLDDPSRLPGSRGAMVTDGGRTAAVRGRERPARRAGLYLRGLKVLPGASPLDAHWPCGSRVALLAGTAGGAAVAAALLEVCAGQRVPAAGEVALGGNPLYALHAPALRGRVARLSPDMVPMRGSVRRFLSQRRPDAADGELLRACALAGWHDADARLLARPLRDAGADLPPLRRRQLTLAAALVGRPDVLLVEDAERALPGDAQVALRRLMQGHAGTLVLSTGTPTLAAMADVCVDLDAGAVAGVGARTGMHARDADGEGAGRGGTL